MKFLHLVGGSKGIYLNLDRVISICDEYIMADGLSNAAKYFLLPGDRQKIFKAIEDDLGSGRVVIEVE